MLFQWGASLIHICLQRLDDILKELHGSHYTLILLREITKTMQLVRHSRLKKKKKPAVWSHQSLFLLLYLLAGFYELIYCHYSISVTIHFLKNVEERLWVSRAVNEWIKYFIDENSNWLLSKVQMCDYRFQFLKVDVGQYVKWKWEKQKSTAAFQLHWRNV